jgi:hypothetical protein
LTREKRPLFPESGDVAYGCWFGERWCESRGEEGLAKGLREANENGEKEDGRVTRSRRSEILVESWMRPRFLLISSYTDYGRSPQVKGTRSRVDAFGDLHAHPFIASGLHVPLRLAVEIKVGDGGMNGHVTGVTGVAVGRSWKLPGQGFLRETGLREFGRGIGEMGGVDVDGLKHVGGRAERQRAGR